MVRYIVPIAICVILLEIALRIFPALGGEVEGKSESANSRVSSIDGIRGYLALLVFASHLASFQTYQSTHVWNWPVEPVLRWTAELSVSMFFAITGFLFWDRRWVMNPGKLWEFFQRRFWRIYPLYTALIVTTILWIRFHSTEGSIINEARIFARWIVPGTSRWHEFGTTNSGLFITQTWSLTYELAFYSVIPFLYYIRSRFAVKPLTSISLISVALGGLLMPQKFHFLEAVTPFLVGMFAADAKHLATLNQLKTWKGALLIILGVIGFAGLGDLASPWSKGLLLILFLPLAVGNDFFGLLNLKSSQFLGRISYSLYLTHLAVINLINSALGLLHPSSQPNASSILTKMLFTFIVMLVSAATYNVLEKPFLKGFPIVLRKRAGVLSGKG